MENIVEEQKYEIKNNKDWFKKHVDTVIVLGGILASVFWMNGKFNEVDHKFSDIEKDIVMIKTVMIVKNVMPSDLAKCEPNAKKKGE